MLRPSRRGGGDRGAQAGGHGSLPGARAAWHRCGPGRASTSPALRPHQPPLTPRAAGSSKSPGAPGLRGWPRTVSLPLHGPCPGRPHRGAALTHPRGHGQTRGRSPAPVNLSWPWTPCYPIPSCCLDGRRREPGLSAGPGPFGPPPALHCRRDTFLASCKSLAGKPGRLSQRHFTGQAGETRELRQAVPSIPHGPVSGQTSP